MQHSLEQSGLLPVIGGNIHYRLYEPHDDQKSKNIPLIIIHGGPGGSHALQYGSHNTLADEQPVLFYDQLGSYFSPATLTDALAPIDRFVDEVHRLRIFFGWEKVSILGHSWGGAVATAFAAQNQDVVDQLILSSPLIATNRWIDDCHRLLRNLPINAEAVLQCEKTGDTENPTYKEANNLFMAKHCCRTLEKPSYMKKSANKWNTAVYNLMWGPSEFSCSGTLKNLDLWPLLSSITARTLLICGAFDSATPETMALAAKVLKNAECVVIPDAGHLSFVDAPEVYLPIVRAFLNKNRPDNLEMA